MAIQGLQDTSSFVADERPLNWREGILMRFPNGHAPLVALTSKMKKKVTDDPEFNWWEREVSNVRLELATDITNVQTVDLDVVVDTEHLDAQQTKVGDILFVEETEELMRVTINGTTGNIEEVERGYAGTTAVLVDVSANNPNIIIIGNAFEEGHDTPESIRYRPTKVTNFTQIFRNSLKATRTAMQTRLRTVEEVQDSKKQALLYHSIGMEYAFWLGVGDESTGPNGQPERTTQGVVSRIADGPAGNRHDVPIGTTTDYAEFEDFMLEAFRFGSQEKMGFCGNRAILCIQRMLRGAAASTFEWGPGTKEFGMDVRRLFTPYGTLVLKTHPLFNQNQSNVSGTNDYHGMDSWLIILDMEDLIYRPLRNSDTQYLPDRQANGVDGLTSEYLTEAGLEIHHAKNHFMITGLILAAAE